MKRLLAAPFLIAFAFNAAAQSQPAPAPLPCRPADATINAVLWMQTSAEYQALLRQAYSTAARTLDAALADPTWTAALEQPSTAAALPPAIVLDLDETMIDTSPHQQGLIVSGRAYTEAGWHEYAMTDASRPLEAAVDFVTYAKQRGVAIYYVTNRRKSEEEALRATLVKGNFPLDANEDTVLTRDEKPEWSSSDKAPRREFIAKTHRIVMLFGDDLNDFIPANSKTLAERDKLTRQYGDKWGRQWFILPNPVYGSWERQMLGDTTGIDDCAQLQRKIKTIKGR
ncbi:MAG TPA: HAD family acid phosphatase [Thermoanaerobaculia bacterium]|nr:HAD family acid phosphatase [Thermoanaerobaculia bacterium]